MHTGSGWKNRDTIPVSSLGSQTHLALPLTVYTCQELKEVSCNFLPNTGRTQLRSMCALSHHKVT